MQDLHCTSALAPMCQGQMGRLVSLPRAKPNPV
jgi:hypothetical protein